MIKKGFTIDEAREYLEKFRWEHPADYGGFSPDGDYLMGWQSRDSCLLNRVNYQKMKECLEALEKTLPGREDDRIIEGFYSSDRIGTWAYDFRASHWLVGWVEYLLVSEDAPDEMIILAAEMKYSMDCYPVFDEDAYSEEECNECWKAWESADLEQRVEWCREVGVSIFSARPGKAMPEKVFDWVRDSDWVQG